MRGLIVVSFAGAPGYFPSTAEAPIQFTPEILE